MLSFCIPKTVSMGLGTHWTHMGGMIVSHFTVTRCHLQTGQAVPSWVHVSSWSGPWFLSDLMKSRSLPPNMRTPQKPSGQVTNRHHLMEVSFSMANMQRAAEVIGMYAGSLFSTALSNGLAICSKKDQMDWVVTVQVAATCFMSCRKPNRTIHWTWAIYGLTAHLSGTIFMIGIVWELYIHAWPVLLGHGWCSTLLMFTCALGVGLHTGLSEPKFWSGCLRRQDRLGPYVCCQLAPVVEVRVTNWAGIVSGLDMDNSLICHFHRVHATNSFGDFASTCRHRKCDYISVVGRACSFVAAKVMHVVRIWSNGILQFAVLE